MPVERTLSGRARSEGTQWGTNSAGQSPFDSSGFGNLPAIVILTKALLYLTRLLEGFETTANARTDSALKKCAARRARSHRGSRRCLPCSARRAGGCCDAARLRGGTRVGYEVDRIKNSCRAIVDDLLKQGASRRRVLPRHRQTGHESLVAVACALVLKHVAASGDKVTVFPTLVRVPLVEHLLSR